jgi:putative restriction endonuclease
LGGSPDAGLLRSDLHTLFDLGYMTVTPDDLRVRVSRRIHLDGCPIRLPQAVFEQPSREMLSWHGEAVFRS